MAGSSRRDAALLRLHLPEKMPAAPAHRNGRRYTVQMHCAGFVVVVDNMADCREEEDQTLAFVPAAVDAIDVARVPVRVRRRVLAAHRRHGVLSEQDAEDMTRWVHGGGFSVDASVGIAARQQHSDNNAGQSSFGFFLQRYELISDCFDS